jgi:uncharacterized protein (DUF2237 family)
MALNVFGEELITCGTDPITGFYRDGCCNTGKEDRGTHTVCAVVTDEFLEFSHARGNDLINPVPAFGFQGLRPGDRWCLCAARWKEAYDAGVAPHVVLEATHEKTLDYIDLETLVKYAVRSSVGDQ